MISTQTRTELHRHLDVAMPIETLHTLAQEAGIIGTSTSLEHFREKVVILEPLANLNDVLARFTLYPKVLYCRDAIVRMAESAVLQCAREGLTHVELRYSPAFVSSFSRIPWNDALTSIELGVNQAKRLAPHLKTGLICIASREFGKEAVGETLEFYLQNVERFVGVDLAGNEDAFPCRHYEDVFKSVRSARSKNPSIHITIHSGEASGPENVWEAIDLLGAERIGHGVRALEDPLLLQTLKRRNIALENCPTSNLLTRAARSYATHPIGLFLKMGVPVTLNTDDPSIFGITFQDEIDNLSEHLGFGAAEFETLENTAQSVSFIPRDSNK